MSRIKSFRQMVLMLALALAVTFTLGSLLTSQQVYAKSESIKVISQFGHVKYSYNKKGLAVKAKGKNIGTVTWKYDKKNRIKEERCGDVTAKCNYDDKGHLKRIVSYAGNYTTINDVRTDKAGRITSLKIYPGRIARSNPDYYCYTFKYSYEKNGRLKSGNGEKFKYNKKGDIKTITDSEGKKKNYKAVYKKGKTAKIGKISIKYKTLNVKRKYKKLVKKQQNIYPGTLLAFDGGYHGFGIFHTEYLEWQ